MAEDKMLDEAIAAIREGDTPRARDILTRLLKTNQNNPDYWLWMSSVVETNRERIFCLQQALRLDPQNPSATRGLTLFGASDPDANPPVPGEFVLRHWSTRDPAPSTEDRFGGLLTPRRIMLLSAGGLLVIALMALGILGFGKPKAPPVATQHVAHTLQPSATLLPTTTPVVRSPTPTISGPTPLWMFLESTYTPTPVYGKTEKHLSEAFDTGMRRYDRGDWNGAITFLQQVVEAQPNAADGYYFIGESYRMLGSCDKALEQYDKAIQFNGIYGPAFLGKARCRFALDPQADVSEDLQRAIQYSPDFGEAYLEQARIAIQKGNFQAALDGLAAAESKLVSSPLLYLYRAKAELALGSAEAALRDAQQANNLDRTLLEGYRVLGEAMQAAGQAVQSLDPLTVYLVYKPEDAGAQVLAGKAHVARQDWSAAEKAFTIAIGLDQGYTEAYVLRGEVYLQNNLNEQALADFDEAVKLSPESFRANLSRGRGLLALQQFRKAYQQFNKAREMAEKDADLAAVYYWRAQSLVGLGDLNAAREDWEALLALPPEALQEGWQQTAADRLAGTPAPTP